MTISVQTNNMKYAVSQEIGTFEMFNSTIQFIFKRIIIANISLSNCMADEKEVAFKETY